MNDTLGTFSLPKIYSALFRRRVRRALSASAAARRLGLVPQDGLTLGRSGALAGEMDEGMSSSRREVSTSGGSLHE